MGNLFGKKTKVTRITEQDKAVLQLKQQRDKLKQYQKKIMLVIEKDKISSKIVKGKQKRVSKFSAIDELFNLTLLIRRAKLLLKKKRYQEQLIDKTDKQLDLVEQLVHDLEFTQVEMQVLESLKVGNESLKEVQKLFSIEDVEKIMDEAREGIEKQQEIDNLLAGALTEEDNEAVEKEFEEILQLSLPEVPEQSQVDVESDIVLPSVPSDEPASKQKKVKRDDRVALEA